MNVYCGGIVSISDKSFNWEKIMASISDVAKRAGVGVGTVSRVLSGNGYVAIKTKEKVEAAIRELDYVPNEMARNLTQNRSNTIAVIVPDISNMFFATMVNELEQKLRAAGYKTLLCNSFGEKTNEKTYLELLNQNLVDGIITASSLLSDLNYASIKKPIVSLDSVLSPDIPMICVDHRLGGRRAAQMLIKAGCKHVLQFRDSVDAQIKARGKGSSVTVESFPYVLRHVEFEKAIRETEIIYEEALTHGAVSMKEQVQLAEKCFAAHPDVDGIFATDILALEYAHVALAHGKRIPEDIKVVAYDGTDLVKLFYPELNAIVQPIADLAQTAVDVLIRQIKGETLEQMHYVLPIHTIEKW